MVVAQPPSLQGVLSRPPSNPFLHVPLFFPHAHGATQEMKPALLCMPAISPQCPTQQLTRVCECRQLCKESSEPGGRAHLGG